MKSIGVIGALAVALALAAPVSAAPIWSDGVNLPYVGATIDLEGEFDTHAAWTDGTAFHVLNGTGSQVPSGWKFAQQSWNGSNNWAVSASTNFTEGDAALKMPWRGRRSINPSASNSPRMASSRARLT